MKDEMLDHWLWDYTDDVDEAEAVAGRLLLEDLEELYKEYQELENKENRRRLRAPKEAGNDT